MRGVCKRSLDAPQEVRISKKAKVNVASGSIINAGDSSRKSTETRVTRGSHDLKRGVILGSWSGMTSELLRSYSLH